MEDQRKKRFAAGGVLLLVLVLIAVLIWQSSSFSMKLGKYRISEEEFQNCMQAVMYDTKAQIQQAYGAEYTEDFWEAEYGDQHGYDILIENTIAEMKYIHAVLELAAENGDVSDATYKTLEKRWKAENKERSEKLANGEVVYGLKEYPFDVYLQYQISTLKETYCNDTDREGMTLTEDEVLEHYNTREWIFGDSEENADLETARIAVERELREKKYDDMVTQRINELEADANMDRVVQFVLENL